MYGRTHMHTTQLDLKEKSSPTPSPSAALHMFVNKIWLMEIEIGNSTRRQALASHVNKWREREFIVSTL